MGPSHATDVAGPAGPVSDAESDLLGGDGIVPRGTELSAACPCCDVPLRTGEIDGHSVLYCRGCGGVLMRTGAFGTVLRNRRAVRDAGESRDVRPLDPDEFLRSLDCPGCGRRLETHPYHGPGNVMIDSCGACELVWLDHEELAELAQAPDHRAPQW